MIRVPVASRKVGGYRNATIANVVTLAMYGSFINQLVVDTRCWAEDRCR
jgi:hypothetical protein